MVTSGTGHDRCPSLVRAHQAPGRHPSVATKKLAKSFLVSRGGQKNFRDATKQNGTSLGVDRSSGCLRVHVRSGVQSFGTSSVVFWPSSQLSFGRAAGPVTNH